MAKDFLGREYGPGDWILYSRNYGNSGSQMILAEVVEVKENTVIARLIEGSRSGKYNQTRLIDSRTGKGISYGGIHVKKPAHYVDLDGKELTHDQRYERNPFYGIDGDYNFYLYNHTNSKYVPAVYWDYVVEGPYNDVLKIKDNVVKVDKEKLNAVQEEQAQP